MSLVEVLPVEPVIATTFVPPAQLPPPRPRQRLQAGERVRVREHYAAVQLECGACVLRRHEHPPGARFERLRRMLAAVRRSPRRPTNRSPAPDLARVDHRAQRPGSTAARAGSTTSSAPAAAATRGASQPLTPRASLRPRLKATSSARSRGCPACDALAGAQRLPGDRHVVEGHLAAPGELLALLVALAGDHEHVARLRAAPRPRRSPRRDRRSTAPARPGCARGARERSTRATPAMISAMICSGSSERGLSEVTTATSASRAAISPISGRLPRSRSPPAPNTQSTRPWPAASEPRQLARGAQHVLERVRRVGVVDEHGEVLALVDRLEAPRHAHPALQRGHERVELARRARALPRAPRARWRR